MPNWIGDFVMAVSVLFNLRKKYKNSKITVICLKNLAGLIKEGRDVDEIIYIEKKESSFISCSNKNDLIFSLRKKKYDLGILLTNSFSSAFLFWKGKVKNRLGFSSDFRNAF